MGCKLLNRTTRKLALTETGKSVYEHALDMLDAAQQAMDSGSSLQTIAQGKLTISVPKAVGRFVIHPLIPSASHPVRPHNRLGLWSPSGCDPVSAVKGVWSVGRSKRPGDRLA